MKIEEKIRIMQAYVDGKKIQVWSYTRDAWVDTEDPLFDWGTYNYRIKPELTYRPYKDTDEMIADFKERFRVNNPSYTLPLIWLSKKDISEYSLITDYDFEDGVCMGDTAWDFAELFEHYIYFDSSPVGKLVEE